MAAVPSALPDMRAALLSTKHLPHLLVSWLQPLPPPAVDCGTTDELWVCLQCAHFACGRHNEKHALKHYKSTNHALVMELNRKLVHWFAAARLGWGGGKEDCPTIASRA